MSGKDGLTAQLTKNGLDKFLAAGGREKIVKIPPEQIRPNPYQPRKHFDKKEPEELGADIKVNGQIQPIVIRKVDDPNAEHLFELVAGERRRRAVHLAGLPAIDAVIRNYDHLQQKNLFFALKKGKQ